MQRDARHPTPCLPDHSMFSCVAPSTMAMSPPAKQGKVFLGVAVALIVSGGEARATWTGWPPPSLL